MSDKKPDPPNDENKNAMDSNEDEDVTFYFFYDLVKRMVLKRQDVGEKCTLSSWLKALEKSKDKIIRNEYIKLMAIAMQNPEPTCPFKDPPPETIDPMENGVIEMARKFMKKGGNATCVGSNESDSSDSNPSINTAVSNDKCQYASCQVIPNVGVQCYYAFSEEPMHSWSLPVQVSAPKNGPHAKDLDWERAMAGMQLETVKPDSENLETEDNKIEKEDDFKSTVSAFTGVSTLGRKKKKNEIEETDRCGVMYIEQQNRNVTEEFGWIDSSMLTGEIILGAEMCSDRNVEAQVKTQSDLDEEVVNVYDKLYPGDFKIHVDPSVVDGLIPPKKHVVTADGDKKNAKEKQLQDDCKRLNANDQAAKKTNALQQDSNRAKKTYDDLSKTSCADNRQSAGQESENQFAQSGTKKNDDLKQRITELSENLTTLMANSGKDKTRVHRADERKCPKIIDCTMEDIVRYKKQQQPPKSSEHDASRERISREKKLSFQRASLVFKRSATVAEECLDSMRSLIRKSGKETPRANYKDQNENYSDSDEPSSSDANY